ncbi:MAG: hypothetical protein RLY30_1288 [Pseudomonadota bacterium]|jgi:hypothetical protein
MSDDDAKLIRPDSSQEVPLEGRAEVVRQEDGEKTIESRRLQDKFVSLPDTLQPADRRRLEQAEEEVEAPRAHPIHPAEIEFPEVTFQVLRVPEALARSPYERWNQRLTEIREVSADIQKQLEGTAPVRLLKPKKKG